MPPENVIWYNWPVEIGKSMIAQIGNSKSELNSKKRIEWMWILKISNDHKMRGQRGIEWKFSDIISLTDNKKW